MIKVEFAGVAEGIRGRDRASGIIGKCDGLGVAVTIGAGKPALRVESELPM